ncbi:glycosyltransferase family 4 protein [Aliiglaciecola sp. 2_MG-2023]|uniref:glycosyltransferase family 4 protein n=1 Tax=unclassified Aliiglaciecola TaxID=2593648 RepID=UPI0026E3F95D|nr:MULTISPECIES: glycosyltransferase family 4 protein [unclassified Aliiglaciecola]MDO6712205.1 glycosyltransferase family 4 protein [Aliiglaciecola sp. 2_MG-2023]MDO6753557.1 glycosyltransferase family 4 protein [Aliiglaciecola sp. 1_MG-2023]
MKVLIVSPGGDELGGGMGTVAKNIKDYLQNETDIKVKVFDSRGEIGFLLSFLYLFRALFLVTAELLKNRKDVLLHINVSERSSFYRKFCFIFIARLFKVPTVLHHHGAELIPFYEHCGGLSRKVVQYCIRNCTLNIVLGEKWKVFLENAIPNHAPIQIMFNAVARHQIPVKTNQNFSIAMIANLSERKGVSLAIEAAKQLKQDYDYTMHFIGGGEVEKYREQAKKEDLEDQCIFHGWTSRENTLKLMADSNILILPSYNEGLPMVILEAMAQAVPVICTPVGSIGEVFTHEKECLFMEVGSAKSLYVNIKRLQNDQVLRADLISAATITFDNKFSIQQYMTCLLKTYHSLF